MITHIAFKLRAALLAILLLVPSTVLAGNGAPKDEAAFTAWMAERIQGQLADARVEVDSPLTLKLRQADGEVILQANLDRIYSFCSRSAAQCEDSVAQYVAVVSEHVAQRSREQAIKASMVRVVVRPREYVEATRKQLPADAPRVVARPLVGDLMAVAVVDFPRSIRLFDTDDAKALKLTEQQVFELGLKNLRASLKPLGEYPQPTADKAFRTLDDTPYESSRLALHAEWKPIAERLGGELIVAVPASDVVIYGRGSATAAGVLRSMASRAADRADRPLSASVFRWTERGWEEVH